MPRPTAADIREVILQVVQEQDPKGPKGLQLSQKGVLNEVGRRLQTRNDQDLEQAVLTQWHELVRTGYFAWGLNLSNPDPPRFHLTERSRRALERLSRDPANPA